jgi:hypothetical protein
MLRSRGYKLRSVHCTYYSLLVVKSTEAQRLVTDNDAL